jgi:hypothetical protein
MLSVDIFKVLNSEMYLFALISAYIMGSIIKEHGYFVYLYNWLTAKFGNNKIVLFIIAILCGILPIEGRVTLSAPLMDSIVKQDTKTRSKMGVVDYLATHHYYFWSPIEPSVLIFLTTLGITWSTFIIFTWPLIVSYFFVLGCVLYFYIDSTDLQPLITSTYLTSSKQSIWCGIILLSTIVMTLVLEVVFKFDTPLKWTLLIPTTFLMVMTQTSFKKALRSVDWIAICMVAMIILGGSYVKQYSNEIQQLIKSDHTFFGLVMIGFISSFILGSSSKYAGIGSMILLTLNNIALLPFILVVEYTGYIFSPTHKCLGISKLYFNTSHLLPILLLLCTLLITVAGLISI